MRKISMGIKDSFGIVAHNCTALRLCQSTDTAKVIETRVDNMRHKFTNFTMREGAMSAVKLWHKNTQRKNPKTSLKKTVFQPFLGVCFIFAEIRHSERFYCELCSFSKESHGIFHIHLLCFRM